ncbi:MAG: hypothetical protein ABGZ35_14035 [Planctomycetaceae bacterium]
MRRPFLALAVCSLSVSFASAQDVGMPGVMYSEMVAGGTGAQLYPFNRQDPWLHGQFQRIPAYGGFNSFRPYNYRHVFAQTQIATSVWGAAHGQPYSQQFWNRYRVDYLNGKTHSQATLQQMRPSAVSPASYQPQPVSTHQSPPARQAINHPPYSAAPAGRPIHVYPSGIPLQ